MTHIKIEGGAPVAGIYDLDAETYHADPCRPCAHSVSSTGLKTILHHSPAHYAYGQDADKPSFKIGRAVHEAILEGAEGWYERYAPRPDDQRGSFTTKAGKAWRDEQEAAGRVILDRGADRQIMAMADSIRHHETARTLLTTGAPEKSLLWQDDQTGAWLRARPDMLPENRRFVPDLKTVEDASPEAVRMAMYRYGWHESAALYLWGVRAVTGIDPEGFFLVCVEKKPPYAVAVYEIGATSLHLGLLSMRRAVGTFAECVRSGQWPGYFPGHHVENLEIPEWAQRRASEAAGDPDDPLPDGMEEAA